MAKGKKTGGRKKGSKNRFSRELYKAAAAGGLLPLDYMLKVMRDPGADDDRRDSMAVSAAPYLHARRAPENKFGDTAEAYVLVTNVNPDDA